MRFKISQKSVFRTFIKYMLKRKPYFFEFAKYVLGFQVMLIISFSWVVA